MNKKQTQTSFEAGHVDDYSVLNFLLEHVKGLSPSSLTPEFSLIEDTEIE
jgi:hypothetical protein